MTTEEPREAVGPTKADLDRALAARVRPRMPEHLGQDPRRLDLAAPSGPVSASYASARFRVVDDELAEYLLQPVPVGPEYPECDEVVDLPAHFVSGWHPYGRPSTYGECQEGHDTLHNALLAVAHYPVRQAVAYPLDQTWFEETHLAAGLTDEQAVEVGRASGQAAVVRWDSVSLTVLPTGLRDDVQRSTTAWRLSRQRVRTCPVRRDDDPSGRCVPYGGPWVSASMHAALLWQAHRTVGISLLGCDPCHDGAEPIWGPRGQALSLGLYDEIIGSRFGSYGWRR